MGGNKAPSREQLEGVFLWLQFTGIHRNSPKRGALFIPKNFQAHFIPPIIPMPDEKKTHHRKDANEVRGAVSAILEKELSVACEHGNKTREEVG